MRWNVLPCVALVAPLSLAHPQESKPDLAAELKRHEGEYQAAEQAFLKPIFDAKSDAERMRVQLDWDKHPIGTFVDRFADLASRAQGTDVEVDASVWILINGIRLQDPRQQRSVRTNALNTVLRSHERSLGLERVASALGTYGDSLEFGLAEASLRSILEKSPHTRVQAAAAGSLADLLGAGSRSGGPNTFLTMRQKEARALYERILRDFPGTPAYVRAEASIFELTRLQVGMVAPDFEGTDQDGKKLKLTDYRGKVVVLDFWGFW